MILRGRNRPVPAALARRLQVITTPHIQQDENPAVLAARGVKMQFTPVGTALGDAYADKKTGVVMEGGSRSSKTHSIIQFLIQYAQDNEFTPKRVLIVRQKSTWTSATVLFDFLQVVKSMGLWDIVHYNKTAKILKMYQTEFWFGGLDDAQKLHGFQSNIFWINEAIEATKDDFDQLEQRLIEFFILDYNPSAEEHWIYDSICKRPDVKYIHSTMLDNPFIAERSRLKILSYDPSNPINVTNGTADRNKWEIYGLGLRSKIEGVIYRNWETRPEIPEHVKRYRHRWGLDWGFVNSQTGIVDVYFDGNEVWVDEICYQTELLYPDIARIIVDAGLHRIKGYADPEDSRGVEDVHRRGVNVHEAKKPAGSVMSGITLLQECKIYVTERSVNLIHELKNYQWQRDKNDKFINEPVKEDDHLLDALRYVIYMEKRPARKTGTTIKNTVAGII